MQTVEEKAKQYFENRMNTEDDGHDYRGLTVTYKLFVDEVKSAFLAGHASRDEEVKELVTTLDRLFESCLDKEFTPNWDSYKTAKQLLSKYSKTGNDGESKM